MLYCTELTYHKYRRCQFFGDTERLNECRYLVELAGQRQLPAVAGVVMIASASLTACVPNMDWWRSQQSFMHAGKVIW